MEDEFYTYYRPPTVVDSGQTFASEEEGETTFGLCGDGTAYQAAVQRTVNPSFQLFTTPPRGKPGYWEDLAGFASEMNEAFDRGAKRLLEMKRKRSGLDRLELTVYLAPDGFRLVYVLPAKKKKHYYPRPPSSTAP